MHLCPKSSLQIGFFFGSFLLHFCIKSSYLTRFTKTTEKSNHDNIMSFFTEFNEREPFYAYFGAVAAKVPILKKETNSMQHRVQWCCLSYRKSPSALVSLPPSLRENDKVRVPRVCRAGPHLPDERHLACAFLSQRVVLTQAPFPESCPSSLLTWPTEIDDLDGREGGGEVAMAYLV